MADSKRLPTPPDFDEFHPEASTSRPLSYSYNGNSDGVMRSPPPIGLKRQSLQQQASQASSFTINEHQHHAQASSPSPLSVASDSDSGHNSGHGSAVQVPLVNAFHSQHGSMVSIASQNNRRQSSTLDDLTPETFGFGLNARELGASYSRYSAVPSRASILEYESSRASQDVEALDYGPPVSRHASYYDMASPPGSRDSTISMSAEQTSRNAQTAALIWDEKNVESDDWVHNPDPQEYKGRALPILADGARYGDSSQKFRPYSKRGIFNVFAILVVSFGLIGIFMFWPLAVYAETIRNKIKLSGWNIGGTNSTGQVPEIPEFPALIDSDTPMDARTRKGHDGKDYVLVFSDEFNTDGRTFYPGDDAYWEATDLNYWATHNYEWTDPSALVTEGGDLRITMTEEPIHGLNFKSGFLQTWNKFCYSHEAYIEVNVSLPGNAEVIGLWPGIWTMGNLGRAGFGATNDGTWPYTYDSCDVGTQPNQTETDGVTPDAAKHSGLQAYGGELSWLPGQKLSACTCKGDDHPGPSHSTGRGAPEIDILEAQVDYHGYGTASQSVQLAPFDAGYEWNNVSGVGWEAYRDDVILNLYKGSITQEAASAVTILDNFSYGGNAYQTFGYEYQSGGSDGYITWTIGGQPTWTLKGVAFAPNDAAAVGQRLISKEPMYIMLNLFISSKFQDIPNFGALEFPTTMYIDYVRVYQPKGRVRVGCDPSDHPTHDYIQRHLPAYTNPNFTTWAEAGYEWPRNSREYGDCDTERAGP